jgi:autotransporter-associated beta strand protein
MIKKNRKSLIGQSAVIAAGVALICGTSAQAQMVSFTSAALGGGNGAAGSTVSATNLGTGMSLGVVSRGSGIANGAGSSRFNSNGFNTSSPSLASAISQNDFVRITLAPSANYVYSLTGLGMTIGSSSTGVNAWAIFAGSPGFTASGSGLASGTFSRNSTSAISPSLGSGFSGLTSATEIRLYGWGATASGGTFGPGNGAALNVNGSAALRSAGTLTWDGGQGNGSWNSYTGTATNQSNWNLNNIPSTSLVDTLAFAGSTQTTTNNNLTGLTVGSIIFNSGAAAFTNGGNSLTLNGAVTNNSANLQTINHALALSNASHSFSAASGSLAVAGAISGSGGIGKTGGNQLTLSGNNSYTGGTNIQDGSLVAGHGKALGTGNVNISGDAQLQVSNGILLNIGAGNSVTLTSEEAVYRKNFSNAESFANANALRSDLTVGGTDTVAAIQGGSASGTGLFAEMSFRASEEGVTLSNILSLNGTGNQTIALSLTVGAGLLDSDSALGWFDSMDGWVLAVAGNTGAGELAGHYTMSYAAFLAENQGVFDAVAMLGAYGVDSATGEVWAVVNHNSDFAVIQAVPEPASATLLAATGVVLVCFRRRSRKA